MIADSRGHNDLMNDRIPEGVVEEQRKAEGDGRDRVDRWPEEGGVVVRRRTTEADTPVRDPARRLK